MVAAEFYKSSQESGEDLGFGSFKEREREETAQNINPSDKTLSKV